MFNLQTRGSVFDMDQIGQRTNACSGVEHGWSRNDPAQVASNTDRGSSTPDLVSSDAIILERYFYVHNGINAAPENESCLCKPAANTVRTQFRSGGSVSISGLWRWKGIEQANTL